MHLVGAGGASIGAGGDCGGSSSRGAGGGWGGPRAAEAGTPWSHSSATEPALFLAGAAICFSKSEILFNKTSTISSLWGDAGCDANGSIGELQLESGNGGFLLDLIRELSLPVCCETIISDEMLGW